MLVEGTSRGTFVVAFVPAIELTTDQTPHTHTRTTWKRAQTAYTDTLPNRLSICGCIHGCRTTAACVFLADYALDKPWP